MIETNIQNLSVEEIMKKIKEAVNIRKTSVSIGGLESNKDISNLDSLNICDIKHNHIDIVQNKQIPFNIKKIYEYSDFTIYNDDEFIKNIYKALLKREPDIAGIDHYLQLLRSGQRTKTEIITSLRFSDEGKQQNVQLLGAKKRYLSLGLSKVPFIGKVYKISLAFLTLDKKMQNIYEYEAYTNRRYIELKKELISLQNAINSSNDKNLLQINNKLSKVINELNRKSSFEDIQRLERGLKQKAYMEKVEVEINKNIKQLQNDLKTKLSKEDIQRLESELKQKAYIARIKVEINENIKLLQEELKTKSSKNDVEIFENEFMQDIIEMKKDIRTKLSIENIQRLENELNQKVDKAEFERITQELKDKVHENTLIEVQKDMDLKLENKVNINRIDIEESLEFCADDFLSSAIHKFNYPIAEFDRFDKEELYYSLFENIFYDSKVVKEKQKAYLKYIPKHNAKTLKHLDIGCGRGEFLLNLSERNFHAKGIDINSIEVETLLNNEFDVEHIDLIEYLSNTPDIFSSISSLQVIEHLDYSTLKEFIQLSYSKIAKNGTIILETINPHNSLAFNSFYMDETHKRPLPPEMVAFLLQWIGFKNIKFVFTSPLPEEYRNYDQRKNYHDYAVIGYKL